jgi:hypothetical protein
MSPKQLLADLEIDLHRCKASRYTLDFGQRQMYRIAPVRRQVESACVRPDKRLAVAYAR